jgi:hypothetical protein
MSNPRISGHYSRYPKYWKDFTRENVKGKACEVCGATGEEVRLTTAHLDQDPQNNQKKTGKSFAGHAISSSTNPITCSVR